MNTYKCDQPDCSFETGFATVLGAHKKKVHGIAGQWRLKQKTPLIKTKARLYKCDQPNCNFATYNSGGLGSHKRGAHGIAGRIQKREREKMCLVETPVKTRTKKEKVIENQIKFCPCCGTNLLKLNVALQVISEETE